MAKDLIKHPGIPLTRVRRSQRINRIRSVPGKGNRNFALTDPDRTESVPQQPPAKSGSAQYPADNNTAEVNVNGKQRLRRAAAVAQATVRTRIEESVKKNSRKTKKRTDQTGKDWKNLPKASNTSYSINTRGTQRSEIVISCSTSISSYYNQLCNEDLVVPNKPIKKAAQTERKINKNTKRYNNKISVSTKGKLSAERFKKVAIRQPKRKESAIFKSNSNLSRKRILLESILAHETEENNSSTFVDEEDEEAEQDQVVPRKSFFEQSIESFCQLHPAFSKATERCLTRLNLQRSTNSMNSPASPVTPAPTMMATVGALQPYQPHISPTTAALVAQHSGKRKHASDDVTDHSYPMNYQPPQSITPPGHSHSNKHQLQVSSNNQPNSNQYRLSPRSWIFQTPDKQKLGKLPPPSTVRDEDEETLIVPVMLHHSKRLKTVYSFDESTVVDLVGGGGGSGGTGMEVQIDSDRLAPICQITTADDGADCEFEASSIADITLNTSAATTTTASTTTTSSTTTNNRTEELNQFQLQQHELSLDFDTCMSSVRSGGGGDGEGAFLDQWVRLNGGGGGDHSPLPSARSRYFPSPSNLLAATTSSISQHLRSIHNVATQRPTKTVPRFDRRQYLERKSLTFEETNACSSSNDTPKVGESAGGLGGRLRAMKQKAASADSISGGEGRMDLFDVARGDLRDISDACATITSGAYERELSTDLSQEQENIIPPSHMRLLLGNLQMNDSVDINYDRPLFPRRNY